MIGTQVKDTCHVTLKSPPTMNTEHVPLLYEGALQPHTREMGQGEVTFPGEQ